MAASLEVMGSVLDQVIRWVDIVGTVADALLLIRLLTLKLHRVYTFVTLYAAVTMVLDAGAWITGLDSPASLRLFIYSRFLMAAVFPLAAWDVFEEIQPAIGKLRRLHTMRLVSGLLLTSVFALIISATLEGPDVEGMGPATIQVAFLLWAATVSGSGVYLWNMRKTLKQVVQPSVTKESSRSSLSPASWAAFPNNTSVLWSFFLLTFAEEVLDCLLRITAPLVPVTAASVTIVALSCFDIALVTWCIVRLRSAAQVISVSRVEAE